MLSDVTGGGRSGHELDAKGENGCGANDGKNGDLRQNRDTHFHFPVPHNLSILFLSTDRADSVAELWLFGAFGWPSDPMRLG